MGYSPVKDVTYVRGFLGRMLFAGEDGVKKVKVLSGGEKVRCLLSKMMISGSNCLISGRTHQSPGCGQPGLDRGGHPGL